MHKKGLIRKEVPVFVLLLLIGYIISLLLFFVLEPAPLANILGFVSLLLYIITFIPSILKTLFPVTKRNKILLWLFNKRRYLGVAAFSFGLSHGVLLILEKNLYLSDLHTYIKHFHGIATLFILTILAFTSNDWSVKKLKSNWKKLHNSTYLLIFLLTWHILASMAKQWSYITPFGVLLIVSTIVLFIKRKWIEQIELKRKQKISKQKTSKQVEKV